MNRTDPKRNYPNGMFIMGAYGGAMFIRLPQEISTEIESGCSCDYCKAHPDIKPRWDTLCVPTEGKMEHTWTVHMPAGSPYLQAGKPRKRGAR